MFGDAKTSHGSKEGTYQKGGHIVHKKPHWLQDDGSNAIWYYPDWNRWMIGHQSDLSTSMRGIQSNDGSGSVGPLQANNWWYYNGYNGNWIKTNDVVLYVEEGKTGRVFCLGKCFMPCLDATYTYS